MTAPTSRPVQDRPLTVLIAAETYPPDVNGAATFCLRLARSLTERGHDVHVVAARTEPGPDVVERRPEATVHRLRSHKAFTHEYFRFALPWDATAGIRRVMREIRPDVVHAQCHYMIGEAALHLAERRRIRAVATNHFIPENMEPFLPFPQWFKDIVSRTSWKDMGRLMSKAAVVTTPTALAAKAMSAQAGLDHVLPVSNGIDAAAYEPAPGEVVTHPDHPVVLFVGRLAVEKNIDVLIRAIGHLARSRPDLDVHAEVAGDGEQRTRLRELAEAEQVTDRVDFLGHVSDEELHAAYLRADVFCQPGTAELQSIVSLEAMSASTPVVLADALALPHLVDEGVNGWLFPPGDHVALAERIARILDLPEAERAAMGEASHAKALSHSADKTVRIFEALYRGATSAEVRAGL